MSANVATAHGHSMTSTRHCTTVSPESWRRYESTTTVARQLTNLMTMVTLRSITSTLEKDLPATEFVVLPIFGRTGQPGHQIEIHIRRPDALTLDQLNTALANAQNELTLA